MVVFRGQIYRISYDNLTIILLLDSSNSDFILTLCFVYTNSLMNANCCHDFLIVASHHRIFKLF